MNTDPSTWCLGDPEAYKCGHCKYEFDFVDAIKDTTEEGVLHLCPQCGSEELDELNRDPELPEIDSILEDAAEKYSER